MTQPWAGVVLFLLYWERGQLGEIDRLISSFGVPAVREEAGLGCWVWQHLAALHALERGQPEQARAIVERLAGPGLRTIPRDTAWLGNMAILAVVITHLDDRDRATELYELLVPFLDLVARWPTLLLPVLPVSYCLGLLATTIRRWADAERHFADALAMSERMSAPVWSAHTRFAWANMLALRDAPGDREHALSLNDQALAAAEEIGMTKLAGEALALKVRLQGILNA